MLLHVRAHQELTEGAGFSLQLWHQKRGTGPPRPAGLGHTQLLPRAAQHFGAGAGMVDSGSHIAGVQMLASSVPYLLGDPGKSPDLFINLIW